MEQLSLWEATANKRTDFPQLEGEHFCDVVIIGGGYSGLSTSYHLQEKNCNTIVLEQNRIGSGASGRNGGEVLTGYLGSMQEWAKKKGLEEAKQMWQMSLDSIDLIESIIKKHEIDCAFVRNGSLYAAYKPSHLEAMKKEQEFMEKYLDYEHMHIVEKEDLQEELNTNFYHGASVDAKSAHFHPLNYALGLGNAVHQMGGKIFEHSKALRIERKAGGKVIVHTEKGRVIAEDIVIVTNAYSGDLHDRIKRSIVPVESIMIATEPLPTEVLEDVIKKNRAVSDSKRLLYYFRRTADNRLAFGGSGRASTKRDQENLFHNLRLGMIEVFPQLKDAKIDYEWGGKVGFTKSMLPYIGQLEDGTYFGLGYGGHGAAMASLFGKLIAQMILKEADTNNPLIVKSLKPIPFHSQHARAVGILKFYKKLQDRIS